MQITNLSQLDLSKTYNYADYFSWKFEERVELFKGKIMVMLPFPGTTHQRVSAKISYSLFEALSQSPSKVYFAPFDVRLERTQDDKLAQNVVQPDICVVCDVSKLDDRGCCGAPDLIVEILSAGNSKKEMKYKFELYEAAGVLEYWIVNPFEKAVLQYHLINNQYINYKPLTEDDVLHSSVLKGFSLQLADVFVDD